MREDSRREFLKKAFCCSLSIDTLLSSHIFAQEKKESGLTEDLINEYIGESSGLLRNGDLSTIEELHKREIYPYQLYLYISPDRDKVILTDISQVLELHSAGLRGIDVGTYYRVLKIEDYKEMIEFFSTTGINNELVFFYRNFAEFQTKEDMLKVHKAGVTSSEVKLFVQGGFKSDLALLLKFKERGLLKQLPNFYNAGLGGNYEAIDALLQREIYGEEALLYAKSGFEGKDGAMIYLKEKGIPGKECYEIYRKLGRNNPSTIEILEAKKYFTNNK